MTANLERVRELLERLDDLLPHTGASVTMIGESYLHRARDIEATMAKLRKALLSPAQPPPEPAPRLSDERIRELVDEGAENGRRMAEAAKSMRPLAPPEPAPADWTRLARNAGWVSPEEQALAIRDATAPADADPCAWCRHAESEHNNLPNNGHCRNPECVAKGIGGCHSYAPHSIVHGEPAPADGTVAARIVNLDPDGSLKGGDSHG